MFELDQAASLRQMFANRRPAVTIFSGDRSAQAAIAHVNRQNRVGQSVLVMDASAGELARRAGRTARYELSHVIDGDKQLSDVLLAITERYAVLPASRGLLRLSDMESREALRLSAQFGALAQIPDELVVHTPPEGVAAALLAFPRQASVVLAASDSIASRTGAYAQLKTWSRSTTIVDVSLVVYGPNAEPTFGALRDAAGEFLGIQINRWQGFAQPQSYVEQRSHSMNLFTEENHAAVA